MFATLLALALSQNILNGRLDRQAAASGLEGVFNRLVGAQTDAAWIGYTVPTVQNGNQRLCCNDGTWISDGIVIVNGRVATCGLEPGDRSAAAAQRQPATTQSPVRLEGPDSMMVLFRIEAKEVQKIRIFSPDCELDAGGRPVHWLDNVNTAESIKLLSSLASANDRVRSNAITALALHREDAAVPELLKLARQDANGRVRGDALFWLAQTAGRRKIGRAHV